MEQFTYEHGVFFIEFAGALFIASWAFHVIWNTIRGQWTGGRKY